MEKLKQNKKNNSNEVLTELNNLLKTTPKELHPNLIKNIKSNPLVTSAYLQT
jgi:hypothetical protein